MNVSKHSLVLAAALTGLLGGTVSRLSGAPTPQETAGQPSKSTAKEKHDCAGKNSCKGKGGCATDGSKDNKAAAAGVRNAEDEPGRGGAARDDLIALITALTDQMHAAAAELQFELAARFRDEIRELKQELRGMQAAGV